MVTRGVFRSNFLIVMLAGGAYTQALAQSSTGTPATPATPSTESSTAAAYQRLKANLYEAKKALFKAEEVVSPKANSLRQEMQILFKEFDCQLPAAVQERIKATNPSGYIPPDLDSKLFPPHVEQLKYTAINGQSAAAALASVQFAPTAPAMLPTSVRLKSSSIYAKLNPFGLIDKSSDAVIYTMDCSGYLTSTFNLDVTVPAASLKTFAQGQMSGARSLAISLATVTSPVMAAIFPTTVPDKMRLSDRDRLELLFSAVVEIDQFKPNAAESLTFEIPRELRLLWASNNGKTSAKASARIEGGAGAGVGVATASASADVGGSISRELTFESFDTYLIQDTALQPSSSMSIKELRALVSDLVASASTSSPDTMNAGVVINRFQASFRDFTKTLCDLKWKPDTSADGSVSTGWDQNTNMCVISFKPAPGWTAVPSVKLKVNGLAPRTPEFWLTVDMPLVGKL